MVGKPGSASERIAEVTAKARSLPAPMCAIAGGVVEKIACTCPLIDLLSGHQRSGSVTTLAFPRNDGHFHLTAPVRNCQD